MNVILMKNSYGDWEVADSTRSNMRWSGKEFVPVGGSIHISNFATIKGATEYAKSFGFKVIGHEK